ncbi:hypothetical protein A2819_02940 [Candidatus Azambacteria bacterium RIFCSPHIGHO2_01_FULL_40_24]|uniref:Uncharacterized protein n=1 Tax=Candidatus Azambacteria bacterium RIFCSPHIGHO2_01_FULL_40_24 TaxID=1797301 RepID=A0A1F5B255_9BACT|nr:MAG: hypothetical protein A2819_02940 [Candidatus Azambacteria bacterium RIFCSPHIGHO2_01_FULL_40_24]
MKKKSAADKKRANTKNYNRLVRDLIKLIKRYKKIIEKKKAKPEIDIKKVAELLGAEIVTDPKKIAEMKKTAYPWRPK